VVCSTFGEGEFPDNALLFWEALNADDADRLEHLSFAVLALGDTSYDLFCNAGKVLDERLAALGATRLVERVDIDGCYEQPAAAWTTDVVKLLAAELAAGAETTECATAPPPLELGEQPSRERHHQFDARVVVNQLLNSVDSDKEVRHYEPDLAGSGIAYQAGDSIAVHATNDPALVVAPLAELEVGPDYEVGDYDEPLGVLLTERMEIRAPSRALQALVANRTHDVQAATALGGDETVGHDSWLYGKDVLDLIRLAELTVDEVVDTLRPLQFRDYSIASSPAVHPEAVHLTVATMRYTADTRSHGGVASTFLADAVRRCGFTCGPTTPSGCPLQTYRSS
jgi:sulfite reductase (NADPH) flavoprotein alpha-component